MEVSFLSVDYHKPSTEYSYFEILGLLKLLGLMRFQRSHSLTVGNSYGSGWYNTVQRSSPQTGTVTGTGTGIGSPAQHDLPLQRSPAAARCVSNA